MKPAKPKPSRRAPVFVPGHLELLNFVRMMDGVHQMPSKPSAKPKENR